MKKKPLKQTKKKVVKSGKPKVPAVQQYTYFVDDIPHEMGSAELQDRMNQAGQMGWQLVAVFPHIPNTGAFRLFYIQPT